MLLLLKKVWRHLFLHTHTHTIGQGYIGVYGDQVVVVGRDRKVVEHYDKHVRQFYFQHMLRICLSQAEILMGALILTQQQKLPPNKNKNKEILHWNFIVKKKNTNNLFALRILACWVRIQGKRGIDLTARSKAMNMSLIWFDFVPCPMWQRPALMLLHNGEKICSISEVAHRMNQKESKCLIIKLT